MQADLFILLIFMIFYILIYHSYISDPLKQRIRTQKTFFRPYELTSQTPGVQTIKPELQVSIIKQMPTTSTAARESVMTSSAIEESTTTSATANKSTPPSTSLPTATSKPVRRNPLYIGTIEEDIPVDDPYFDYNGDIHAFMQSYITLHKQLTQQRSNRVVIYVPMKETGLGNSLLALSSCFVYAALTKRAFLLNYSPFTKHYTFDFPKHNSTYTFNSVPPSLYSIWNRHYNIMQPTDKSMRINPPRKYSRRPGVIATGFLSFMHLIIRHDNYTEKLVKMGFLDSALVKPESERLNMGSKNLESYYLMLGTEVTHTFLRQVLKPQPWVREIVDSIIQPHQNKFLLGIHIRFGSSGGTFRDSHEFLKPQSVWLFATQAETVLKRKGIRLEDSIWILSTDSDKAEEQLREKYGNIIVTNTSYKRGHSKTGAKNAEGYTRAVIDISLLSRCDYLILTRHSTFSEIAGMMSADMKNITWMASHGYW